MSHSQRRSRLLPVWILLIVVIVAVTTFLYLRSSREDDKTAEEGAVKISLRLKWLWYAGWAGELVAMKNNIWADHGLSVAVEPGGFELDPIKIVASGSNDIGVAGADQILLAREKGIRLIAFATQYQISPVGFVSKAKSQITTVADFRGAKIGVKYGTDVEPVYRALLAKAGLTPDDLEEVPVKFDLAPFFADAIAVYPGYLTNDLLIPEEQEYEVNVIRATDLGVSVYGNVYFCTQDFLEENRETVRRFYEAIKEAWQQALAMPPEQVAALALEINDGLNLAHETRVVESLQPYVLPEGIPFGEMSDDGWMELYEMLRKQGVLETDFNFKSAYTLDILGSVEP